MGISGRARQYHDGIALHRHHRNPLIFHPGSDHDLGVGQWVVVRGRSDAGREVGAQLVELSRGAGRECVFRVDHDRQRVVVDFDQLDRVARGRP